MEALQDKNTEIVTQHSSLLDRISAKDNKVDGTLSHEVFMRCAMLHPGQAEEILRTVRVVFSPKLRISASLRIYEGAIGHLTHLRDFVAEKESLKSIVHHWAEKAGKESDDGGWKYPNRTEIASLEKEKSENDGVEALKIKLFSREIGTEGKSAIDGSERLTFARQDIRSLRCQNFGTGESLRSLSTFLRVPPDTSGLLNSADCEILKYPIDLLLLGSPSTLPPFGISSNLIPSVIYARESLLSQHGTVNISSALMKFDNIHMLISVYLRVYIYIYVCVNV